MWIMGVNAGKYAPRFLYTRKVNYCLRKMVAGLRYKQRMSGLERSTMSVQGGEVGGGPVHGARKAIEIALLNICFFIHLSTFVSQRS
jgi:hypothetical protein